MTQIFLVFDYSILKTQDRKMPIFSERKIFFELLVENFFSPFFSKDHCIWKIEGQKKFHQKWLFQLTGFKKGFASKKRSKMALSRKERL